MRQGPGASDAFTPRARSTSKKRGGKGKSKKPDDIPFLPDDNPFLPLARKFMLGEPLVKTVEPDCTLGMACTRMHLWYVEQANKTDEQRCSGVDVKFKKDHLNHDRQDCVFTVTFEDLFFLFNLIALDVSLMRCWTL